MTEVKSPTESATVLAKKLMLAKPQSQARCACGHEVSHPDVLPEPIYTNWAWLSFAIGVTAKPLVVVCRCLWCKKILATTRDPNVLCKFD